VLARAKRGENAKLLADNDRMLTDLWAATVAAFETIANLDFSTAFIGSVNDMVELDAARKASRLAHVPTTVLVVLSIYIVVTVWSVFFGPPLPATVTAATLASGYGVPNGILHPPKLPPPGEQSQKGLTRGTIILVGVFLLAFIAYYFVNWKYLSLVWGLS